MKSYITYVIINANMLSDYFARETKYFCPMRVVCSVNMRTMCILESEEKIQISPVNFLFNEAIN